MCVLSRSTLEKLSSSLKLSQRTGSGQRRESFVCFLSEGSERVEQHHSDLKKSQHFGVVSRRVQEIGETGRQLAYRRVLVGFELPTSFPNNPRDQRKPLRFCVSSLLDPPRLWIGGRRNFQPQNFLSWLVFTRR